MCKGKGIAREWTTMSGATAFKVGTKPLFNGKSKGNIVSRNMGKKPIGSPRK